MDDSDLDIPFVQAVYIDGELTDVPPEPIMVHSISIEEDTTVDPVAVAIATEISPRISLSSASRGHEREEDTFSTAAVSLHEEDNEISLQVDLDPSPSPNGHEDAQMFGAAAAGAVLGIMMGGPFFSAVLGLGMMYHSQQDGAMGDVARAVGEVALLTRTRFEELNEKHHLVKKGKEAAGKALKKIKEADQRHHHRCCCKREKFQRFLAICWKSLVAFENKHHLLGRVSTKAKNHLDALVDQYARANDESDINRRGQ